MENKSLQIKIVTFLMVAVPIFVISYVFIWENASQRKTAEIEKNMTITTAYAQLIEQKIQERKDILGNLALMLNLEKREYSSLLEILRSLRTHNDENYYITDLDGDVIISSNYGLDKLPGIKDNQYYKQALQGATIITPLEKSPFSGENVITIFTPIMGNNINGRQKIAGVIAGELSVSFFKSTLDSAVIGKNGRIALADNRGNYIYGKDIDNKTKLVVSNCFFEAKGQDKAVVERRSSRTKAMNVFTMVRLKNFGWYAIAVQPSADLSIPGLIILTKNVIILVLVLITIFVLWRYKASMEYRNQLVKRQRAEKLALVGELAAGMAHEIRNPLTAVKGFAQLLKSKDKYAEDTEILNLIGSSVDHIEGIVRETLLLAKPQKMQVSIVRLRNLVEETIKLMRNEAILKEINLEVHCGGNNCTVSGDEIHLKQVLVNIIKNAIEATPKHGRIDLSLELTERNTVLIIVKDNGAGIRKQDLDKIGTPFFTTKPSGTGLGLSVSKRIIEEHRGTFDIKSRPGKGATIIIELPLSNTEG